MGRRVQEIENRRDERLEVRARSRKRRGPGDPIELRIQPSIVEGESVAALHSAIESHLFPCDRSREEIETERPVPYEVVFLTPRK